MVREYSTYGALKAFSTIGLLTITAGLLLGVRFLYFFFFGNSPDLHVQSLILAAILMLSGFQMVLTGILADLTNGTRSLLEDVSYRLRRLELRATGPDQPNPEAQASPELLATEANHSASIASSLESDDPRCVAFR
jgi:hypothetical protein